RDCPAPLRGARSVPRRAFGGCRTRSSRIAGPALAPGSLRRSARGPAATREEEAMNRTRLALAGLVIGAFAAAALGQNADKNSAGPTKNDYRLRVVEPAEGATVTGPTVRVI